MELSRPGLNAGSLAGFPSETFFTSLSLSPSRKTKGGRDKCNLTQNPAEAFDVGVIDDSGT